MSGANPQGATVEGAAKRIASLFSEPTEPTEPQGTDSPKESTAETKQPEETPTSDTETGRRIKAMFGDLEVELEVLTEGVDLDLIPKGLMMEKDYRHKTMELGEQRKSIEAKQSEIQSQLQDLETLLYGEAKELDSDDMKQLRENDPEEYLKKRESFDSKAKKLKKYKEQAAKELQDKQAEILKAEQSKYSNVIPEWLDNSTKAKDTQLMASYLKNNGFSDDEMSSIYDHRLMKIFRDATLYQELKNTPIETKRSKTPPKHQSPGGAEKPQEVRNKARERLKKTGKIQDAQAALKAYLGG